MLNFRKNPLLWLWLLFAAAAVAMTARNLLLPSANAYTHYNNYIIFKQSFFHWFDGLNMYIHYPEEQYDLYKYSPAFAMAFGVLAWMPDWLGLGLWNLMNVWVLVYAISKLPLITKKQQLVFGLLMLQETITATINSQSNALIAGLLILAWVALEKDHWWKAALFIGITVFIKLFGILFFALFLFYPKWWRGIIPALTVMAAFFLIPVVSGGWDILLMQYRGYFDLLSHDHGTFVKYSVMGWLQSWFGLMPPKNVIVFAGLAIQALVTVVMFMRKPSTRSKALYAASWMIWMVIFNHMAESATFVIAVAGVMMWFYYSDQNKWYKLALLIPVMAFTCFGPSDIYPPALREKIVITWQLKVFPCILVWGITVSELLKGSISSSATAPHSPS